MPTDAPEATACPTCVVRPTPFAGVFAALEYGGALADALVGFKHAGRVDAARLLAPYLAPGFAHAASCGSDLVVPVPLHPRKLRRRGYNQSALLASAALRCGERVRLPFELEGLFRVRDTEELGHASPRERAARVENAFRASRRVAGRRVLLVDDVMTTGATAAACAGALLEAGAREVRVAVLARAT